MSTQDKYADKDSTPSREGLRAKEEKGMRHDDLIDRDSTLVMTTLL